MSDPIDSWFSEWLWYHLRLNPANGLPRPQDPTRKTDARDQYGHWRSAFISRKVAQDEAREASQHMAEAGSCFADEHLSKLLQRISSLRIQARHALELAELRKLSEEHTRRVDEHARLKQRWAAMPEEEREAIREEVRKEVPEVAEFESMIFWHCLERLKERIPSGNS